MKKHLVLSLVLIVVMASCSRSEKGGTAASRIELEALVLLQREGGGNILGSTSWKTWALRDGTWWIQRVESTRDLKHRESNDAWRSRGGVWNSRITRWHATLPEAWWNDAERLAGELRFFEQSEQAPDPGRFLDGNDQPTIVAISRTGRRRKVSKWDVDRVPDFDPLYEHLTILRKQIEKADPEYEGTLNPTFPSEAEDDWQPPGFPSRKETQ